ncbi:hypothetical protein scyTo_0000604 [Scyliorhinus torazame]|uniref:Uncharacterized protein n=1 Tax=Scyliorhinus torazame TaxID=75743 RepID=A0A401P031_SCYTO|nr:hypothetical protein [Scyliorhinus torazame]
MPVYATYEDTRYLIEATLLLSAGPHGCCLRHAAKCERSLRRREEASFPPLKQRECYWGLGAACIVFRGDMADHRLHMNRNQWGAVDQ